MMQSIWSHVSFPSSSSALNMANISSTCEEADKRNSVFNWQDKWIIVNSSAELFITPSCKFSLQRWAGPWHSVAKNFCPHNKYSMRIGSQRNRSFGMMVKETLANQIMCLMQLLSSISQPTGFSMYEEQ